MLALNLHTSFVVFHSAFPQVIVASFPDYPYTGSNQYPDSTYPTIDDKAAAVSDDIFGTFSGGNTANDTVNLAQQLHDCSFGKLSILPKPDPNWTSGSGESLTEAQLDAVALGKGVMHVNMTQNLESYTSETAIRNDMRALAEAQLPGSFTINPGPFDHVIFVRDRCVSANGGCGYAACKLRKIALNVCTSFGDISTKVLCPRFSSRKFIDAFMYTLT